MVGTLGILEEAAKRGLIDIEQTTKELKETNFRASERLYQTVLLDAATVREFPRTRLNLWPRRPNPDQVADR
ncbi:MAG: DUF3368 domain-containing protein [Isosphaeraceae bacterium]